MMRQGTTRDVNVTMAVAVLALGLVAAGARADPWSHTETWSQVGTAGWTNLTAQASLSNPGGYLNVRQQLQSAAPMFGEDVARLPLPPDICPTRIAFRFRSGALPPSRLALQFQGGAAGNVWECVLTPPPANEERAYDVPVDLAAGWTMGASNSVAQFEADRHPANWVGVLVRRHGSPAAQDAAVDDVVLTGIVAPVDSDADGMADGWETSHRLNPGDASDAGVDADRDGMSNYAEYRAGTDPTNAASFFAVAIAEASLRLQGRVVVLRWHSISNRTYAVERSDAPDAATFAPLAAGVPAGPPENHFVDPSSTNQGRYFYRVRVE